MYVLLRDTGAVSLANSVNIFPEVVSVKILLYAFFISISPLVVVAHKLNKSGVQLLMSISPFDVTMSAVPEIF